MVRPLRQRAYITVAFGIVVLSLSLIAVNGQSVVRQRQKRAVVDFGVLLRNVLLKSAQLSNVKANITRTIITAKTPMRTTTTTTTTTTPMPPPPPPPLPPLRPRPIYRPLPWPGHGYPIYGNDYYHPGGRLVGYHPYDYDADYDDQPPPTRAPPPATPPTTTAPPPRPTRVNRPPPPPPPLPYDYYYDEYNARPRVAGPPAPPLPPPVAQSPRRRLTVPNARRPAQLSNNLIYQYAQSDDIYSNPDRTDDQEAVAGAESDANIGAASADVTQGTQDASDVDANDASNDDQQDQPQTRTTTITDDGEQQENTGDGSVANPSGEQLAEDNQAVVDTNAADQQDARFRQFEDSNPASGNPTAGGRFIIKYDDDTGREEGAADENINIDSGSGVGSGAVSGVGPGGGINDALSFRDFQTDFTPATGSSANAYFPPIKGFDEYARQQYYF